MLRSPVPHVVIVGGGFGGLEVAKALRRAPVAVTLVDRQNHHLFQPLLYQVASATLSPEDIATPIRKLVKHQRNTEVLMAEAASVDLQGRRLLLEGGASLDYEFLVLATGATHSYFGHPRWRQTAPGLKTLGDALRIRNLFLGNLERAEQEADPHARRALLTFVIVGGGATGVELAGTLKEMSRLTLPRDFRRIRAERARVVLVEAGLMILPGFGEGLSEHALHSLERIGVEVRLGQGVTDVDAQGVWLGQERIRARTVLWAAGVAASPLGRTLGVPTDGSGRVKVEPDLALAGHPEVFVIGDLACFAHGLDRPLPGVASVAQQQGRFAGEAIRATLQQRPRGRFQYRDKGSMATIGRGSAIAQLGRLRLTGLVAWLLWLLVHLLLLVDYRNRVFVFFQWVWAYLTAERRARIIVEPGPEPGRPSGPEETR